MLGTAIGGIIIGVIGGIALIIAEKESELRYRREKAVRKENERIADRWRQSCTDERRLTITRKYDDSFLFPPQQIKQTFCREKDARRRKW